MNKIALALLLALGTANVSSVVAADVAAEQNSTVTSDLDKRIKSLSLNEKEKGGVMQLVKDHKALAAAAGLVLALTVAGGAEYYFRADKNDSLTLKAINHVIAGYNATKTYVVGKAAVKGHAEIPEVVKDGKVITPFQAATNDEAEIAGHPYYSTAAVVTLAALIFAAYDLTKKEDKSALRKLFKKLTAKKNEDKPVVA